MASTNPSRKRNDRKKRRGKRVTKRRGSTVEVDAEVGAVAGNTTTR